MGGKVGQLGGGVIDQSVRCPYNLPTMGRAPLIGGPQRVSPHVVPKKSFSDEDEKTTIEADTQWADEPSTTVEQGDQKLGRITTNVTNTNGVSLDEHTVDDQGGSVEAGRAPARLVITAGNDSGVSQDLVPGKSYTIGRGLDNDLVLTDIAVSRKHFDLRNDAGTWVIVDRGSGNGTVVNGNLEDNPFMLANGDVIEIGTTTFRFDFLTAAVPRPRPQLDGFGSDDDEMSTVAGKPLNAAKTIDSVDVQLETPSRVAPVPPRPKTLPPPAIRARAPSSHGAYPQPPSLGPQAPTMLAAEPLRNLAPVPMAPMYGGYPQQGGYPQAQEIPPHSVHAQMLVAAQLNKRGDLSTAHVQPIAYSSMVAQPEPSAHTPLPRNTKLALIFGGIAAVALFTTIAIVKSGGAPPKVAEKAPIVTKGSASITPLPPPVKVTPIEPPPPPPSKVIAQTPPPPKPLETAPPRPEPPKAEPAKTVAKIDPPKQIAPTKQPPPKQPAKQETTARKTVVKVDRPDPPKPEKVEKRVATADAASDRAETLYKDRKFTDASTLLASASKTADAEESRELRTKAQKITLFAKAFNSGMAPGGKAGEQFDLLQTATNYDQSLGGFFQADITAKLQTIVGKAAISFFSTGAFEKAHQAVQKAEAVGSGGDHNVQLVKENLEAKAQALYGEAMSDPTSSSSKDKLKQVKGMLDSKSPTYQKASKALAAS